MKKQGVHKYNLSETIAVAYLARGADKEWLLSCKRFLDSYKCNDAGIEHNLYVIFKGFLCNIDLEKAKVLFSDVPYKPVFLGDDGFDIGAYIIWSNLIKEQLICVLNTTSEILTDNWLRKLSMNLAIPNVGLVGATASYESINEYDDFFPVFPNIHVRSNAFMINRELFCNVTENFNIKTKNDAFRFESGQKSLTRQILAIKKNILLVGRNGRGYSPQFWPISDTFRQGMQSNLLVADNQTRNFSMLPLGEKKILVTRTWGKYIERESKLLRWRS